MLRAASIAALALAGAACTAQPRYVVRLDLEQVAARTTARDAAPGFASLAR